MRCRICVSTVALLAAVVLVGALGASAQEDPEEVIRNTPVNITPPVGAFPRLEAETTAEAPPAPARPSPRFPRPTIQPPERRIEQRVDGQNINRPIKPERKTPKNVMRIDDKNKRKVQPKAVIKSTLSPWGYTRRYVAGEVVRPEPKPVVPPGTGNIQGLPGQQTPGSLAPGLRGIGGSRSGRGQQRGRRGDDD